jgi:ABC-type sugar transport system permease subunit
LDRASYSGIRHRLHDAQRRSGPRDSAFPFYVYRSAFGDDRLGFAAALSITIVITVACPIPFFYLEGRLAACGVRQ